jgi:hypothetical protein
MKFDFDAILSNMADYHLPFAGVVFITGSVLQWYHRLDASYITFTTTILTFIGTHAYMQNKNGVVDNPAPASH